MCRALGAYLPRSRCFLTRCHEEAGLTYPILEMVGLERVESGVFERVYCSIFDREIRPQREDGLRLPN